MTISKDKVVQFHYRISELDGHELETSFGSDPTAYLHGYNNMMKGIEDALDGKNVGDNFNVELAPETTFGPILDNAEQRVPVKHLVGGSKWKVGMTAVVNTEQGQREVTIVKMGKFMATINTNHPLAGKTLNFELQVEEVRDASSEEIEHGHAHGPGGHHH